MVELSNGEERLGKNEGNEEMGRSFKIIGKNRHKFYFIFRFLS